MSIIRINDGLNISITHDVELEQALQLFLDILNSEDFNEETERKIKALDNAMNLYDGNYKITNFY